MSAYLQMGHDTENLVGETDLDEFQGIILSPVNRDADRLQQNVPIFRERGDFDIVLDPQLYFPRGQRENLVNQPYFPDGFNTLDFSVPSGWTGVIDGLAQFAEDLAVDAVASPVIMPRRWADEYYDVCIETSHMLSQALNHSIRALTTCLVSLADLTDVNRSRQIASILTRHDTEGYYVVLDTNIEPRRELSDADGISAFMSLIRMLNGHAPTTVAFSSSDMILYKAAGATNCSTSKFFNLRRFTTSRFEEPPGGGGGQLPYWFEHNLLAFIREADIRRLQRDGFGNLIGGLHSNSCSGDAVLDCLDNSPGQAWVGKSWRQYLSWFGKTEQEVSVGGIPIVRNWLQDAERNWRNLEDEEILMDEPRNDGSWIRPWRQALRDFSRS